MPDSSRFLLATRASELYLLDLHKKRVNAIKELQNHAIPRAIVVGYLYNNINQSIALITANGDLYIDPAHSNESLKNLQPIDQIEDDVWSMSIIPGNDGTQAQLLISCRGGRLVRTFYDQHSQQWQSENLPALNASWLNTVRVEPLTADEPPLILAGGSSAGSGGILHLLTLAGDQRFPPISFSSPVLDVRTVKFEEQPQSAIAVTCDNGNLYLVQADGMRLWRYRVGRAARSLAVYDIDNDGKQEIIVGGERPDEALENRHTVMVLGHGGEIQWIIPAQAPVTHVAVLHVPGQNPELLIGDLDRTLQVVAVHPPDGEKEKKVLRKAAACFDLLAARQQVSRRELALQWLNQIPSQLVFLQAYAFYECGQRAANGDDVALSHLLNIDIQSTPPLMHRAYARALVHVAAKAPPALTTLARQKLITLFNSSNPQREVGIAAMRAIMLILPKKLNDTELISWSPVLMAAGQHPHAEVQRAVLYVLRTIHLLSGTGNLHPEVWSILGVVMSTPSDDDPWVHEAAAGFVRDLSADQWGIWVWVHLLYAKLGELSLPILQVLSRDDAPFIPKHALKGATRALIALIHATDGEMASKALTELTTQLINVRQAANAGNQYTETEKELAEIYTIIERAVQLTTYETWELFVSNHNSTPLRRVTELLTRHESLFVKDTFQQGWNNVCTAVNAFRASETQAEDVRRLQTELRNQSTRISHYGHTSDGLTDTAVSPLSLALTGMLYAWNREDGPLSARLDALTRPTEPELIIVDTRLQRDEIRIDATIWNSGHGVPIYEINGRFDQAILKIDFLEFACQQELGEFRRDITLQPQEKHRVQFRVLVSEEQQKALNLVQQTNNIVCKLQLPIHFLQGGKTVYRQLLCEGVIKRISRSNLDFTSALPRAWTKIDQRLRQALNDSAIKPVLVYASPLVRDNIVQAIANYTKHSHQPIVDWRTWLDHLYTLQQNNLYIEEGPLLQWLANQIWPQITELKLLRPSYVQRTDFRALINDAQIPNPQLVIFNHWDRLLYNIGRRGHGWNPLDSVLPFLISTLRAANIRPVFIGNRLCETMMQTLWPQLTAECTIIYANHIDITHKENRAELENVLQNLLQDRNLDNVLTQFTPPLQTTELIEMSAGYLAFIEHILLPALEELQQNQPTRYKPLQRYLYKQIIENNFFSLVWMWFGFFECIAIVLTANGEIPLERRRHAEIGFVLSRDYYARRPNLHPVPQPTLKAGTVLGEREVLLIHSNQYYRPNDVWIRGFDWQRPSFSDLGDAGQLFMQLLAAGGGQQLFQSLVDSRILRIHQSRHVNQFFKLNIPFYAEWIRNEEIWPTMIAAARTVQPSWFPQRIAHDRRQKRRKDTATLLFPQKKPELAHRDVPINAITAIEQQLSAPTKPLFFNLFGFASSNRIEVEARWDSLTQVALAFTRWPIGRSGSEINNTLFKALFEAIGTLLALHIESQTLQVESLNDQLLPWTMAEIGGQFRILRPRVMLIALQSGDSFRRLDDLRHWVAERFEQQITDGTMRPEQKKEMLDRSVAIVFVQRHSEHLEKMARVRGIGPHFVFLNMTHLIDMALDVDPQRRLINFAFDVVGRHSFTPYHLAGSLAAGSPLFVGRGSELNTILNSLDSEDHAILGSRRIGKTSLLEQIYYHIRREQKNGRNIPVLFIRLQDQSQVKDFYWQIKEQLKQIGMPELSAQLADNPKQDYSDLYAVMQQLQARTKHPVVILMDEVDGLYLHDLHQNRESLFQFLRNQLAQANTRYCTFILTGFRHIYLSRLRYGSVFYNFCRFHNLVGVQRNDVARLVGLLKEFSLEIHEEDEVMELITQGTHAIPYYVQRLCDQLLRRMSRPERQGRHYIDVNDVQAVLEADLQILLKRELWDDLDVDPLLAAIDPGTDRSTRQIQMVKMRLVILTTVLTLYQHKFNTGYSLANLAKQNTTFTAVDALRYLNEFNLNLGGWQPDEKEIDRLLRSMTMTLALAPSEESRWAYTFPNDILPDVLFYHEHEGTMDLLSELEKLQQQMQGA